jgi:hypothetical protein
MKQLLKFVMDLHARLFWKRRRARQDKPGHESSENTYPMW